MTDEFGKILEGRIIALENRVAKMDKDNGFLLDALIKWIDAPAEERNILRALLETVKEELKGSEPST